MLNPDQKYLINELHNFVYLKNKKRMMEENQIKALDVIDQRINDIDTELNSYHIPSIKYDKVSIGSIPTTKSNRIIELLSKQEELAYRKAEIEQAYEEDLKLLDSRISAVDNALARLSEWERVYIEDMYIATKGIEFMIDKYSYSKSQIYRKATKIINKMLSH